MSSSQSQNSLFRQQQHLYRSAHFLAKSKLPTLYTPPSNDGSTKGRKRRASFEDEEMTTTNNNSNRVLTFDTARHSHQDQAAQNVFNNSNVRQDILQHHTIKRNRTNIKKQFPITKLLATLEKDKLIELINDLVDSNPHLKNDVDAFIPPPTTQSISLVIANLEKKLQESFPYSKNEAKDEYAYSRVKPVLIDIVSALLEYAEHFTSSRDEFPTTIFSYLHYATCVANRLPNWENEEHNQIKKDLYTELINYWKNAIDIASSKLDQGKIYGQQVVTEWAKELAQHDTETNGQFNQVVQQFVERLGWIIGIDNTNAFNQSNRLWS